MKQLTSSLVLVLVLVAFTVTADYHDPNHYYDYDYDIDGDKTVSALASKYIHPDSTELYGQADAIYSGGGTADYTISTCWSNDRFSNQVFCDVTNSTFYGAGGDHRYKTVYIHDGSGSINADANCGYASASASQ